MARTSLLILFSIFLGFWGGSACENDRSTPPPQSNLDAVFQIIVEQTVALSQAFANAQNCDDFNNTVANVPEEIACTNGGSLKTTVESSDCSQDNPLMANVTIQVIAQNCTLEGKASTGTLTTVLAFDGEKELATLAGQSLVILAIKLDFSGVEIQIEDQMATMCSGTMTVFDSNPCTVNSDCSGCTLD